MNSFKLWFAIIILVNVTSITELYSSADERNFREAERAFCSKIDQAYKELCKFNPSQEKIDEFKKRNNPIIDAALIQYQIEKLLALQSEGSEVNRVSSTQSRHRDSQGWYSENPFELDRPSGLDENHGK